MAYKKRNKEKSNRGRTGIGMPTRETVEKGDCLRIRSNERQKLTIVINERYKFLGSDIDFLFLKD